MKAALIFIGEAFRGDGAMKSGQMCRTRGDPSSFPDQKLACETHMNFVRKLEQNWEVDVFIDTYDTQFNLEITSTKTMKLNLKLLDMSGRKIRNINTSIVPGTNQFKMDVSNLASGMYCIAAQSQDGVVRTMKFFKK